MSELSFFVNIIPTKSTHQSSLRVLRSRSGRFFVGKFSKSPIKRWVSEFSEKISKFKPDAPFDGPMEVEIEFRFPYNKSAPRKIVNTDTWKTTRPDLDNMEKVILDTLASDGFIVDDSLIVSKITRKMHSPKVGISIFIKKLP
jgi:Holliday junction resolvase RusA-like endonuclease